MKKYFAYFDPSGLIIIVEASDFEYAAIGIQEKLNLRHAPSTHFIKECKFELKIETV